MTYKEYRLLAQSKRIRQRLELLYSGNPFLPEMFSEGWLEMHAEIHRDISELMSIVPDGFTRIDGAGLVKKNETTA